MIYNDSAVINSNKKILEVLGKEESLARIDKAIEKLSK